MASCEDVEERLAQLVLRHKQEKKELQGKLVAMRKAVTKPDKNKKKVLSQECETLEKQLADRHLQELENLKMLQNNSDQAESERVCVQMNEEQGGIGDCAGESPSDPVSANSDTADAPRRISRTQRRRDKKEQQERERRERIAEAERDAPPTARQLEMCAINGKLAQRQLRIKHVPSDGNCMYAAICDQLHQCSDASDVSVEQLRRMVAAEMRVHPLKYRVFLTDGSTGAALSDQQYEQHLALIEQTCSWGGQVELAAAAAVLSRQLVVVQAEGDDVRLGCCAEHCDQPEGRRDQFCPLILTFHRHLYTLGEHYNSTQPVQRSNDDNVEEDER